MSGQPNVNAPPFLGFIGLQLFPSKEAQRGGLLHVRRDFVHHICCL